MVQRKAHYIAPPKLQELALKYGLSFELAKQKRKYIIYKTNVNKLFRGTAFSRNCMYS